MIVAGSFPFILYRGIEEGVSKCAEQAGYGRLLPLPARIILLIAPIHKAKHFNEVKAKTKPTT